MSCTIKSKIHYVPKLYKFDINYISTITHLGGARYIIMDIFTLRSGEVVQLGIRQRVVLRNFIVLGRTDIHVTVRIVSK